jgi:hypothetical protein
MINSSINGRIQINFLEIQDGSDARLALLSLLAHASLDFMRMRRTSTVSLCCIAKAWSRAGKRSLAWFSGLLRSNSLVRIKNNQNKIMYKINNENY